MDLSKKLSTGLMLRGGKKPILLYQYLVEPIIVVEDRKFPEPCLIEATKPMALGRLILLTLVGYVTRGLHW